MPYSIEPINDSNQLEMVEFLKERENYALFLLGNFENYGPALSEAPHSGNFKLIRSLDKVVGVFCLTNKGSLLIESSVKEPIYDSVLASCDAEGIPIKGLVGNWDFCNSFWKHLKERGIIRKETFASKEILYTINLAKTAFTAQPCVKQLAESDFIQWKSLRLDYLKEEGFPNDLSDHQLLEMFLDKARKKIIWGFFLNERLVSIADLNAKALDLGQVGGVYTDPSFRQKGYSKSVMHQLLLDAKEMHSIRKIIIFTGEKNLPAQKLYIGLGVENVGYFALLFGTEKKLPR